MNIYKAFYRGRSMELPAVSQRQAQCFAAKEFKARKSYDVAVVLLALGEREVTHSTVEFGT